MWLHLFTALPSNILQNINYLEQDYVGLNINPSFMFNFVIGITIALLFFILSCLIGKRIRELFFKYVDSDLYYVADFALGSITIGSGILLLGLFSLLNHFSLSLYILLLTAVAIYNFEIGYLKKIKQNLLADFKNLKSNKFVFIWLLMFILLALINLMNPEIREDQYHVDLPKMYLSQKTIMIPPKEQLHVSASPLLSEMTYLLGIFIWSEESARYIHFLFYLMTILILFKFSKIKNYEFAIYTPLLFATAPVVIHETSSMYVDFQWTFYLMLSILILLKTSKNTFYNLLLSGIFIGAMLSSKLWTIVFIPILILYLLIKLRKQNKNIILMNIFVFALGIILVSALWFLRAFILTGNPFYPAFVNQVDLGNNHFYNPLSKFIKINFYLINPLNSLNVFSPLFFVGIPLLLYKLRNNLSVIRKERIFILLGLFLLLYLSINYPYGRYLLGLYVLLIFFSALGIEKTFKEFKLVKIFLNLAIGVVFLYYFLSSVLVLPYTIGIDNKNSYLTRILSKDNSSYYNFDNKFDKNISKNDYVATYGVYGYYYSNFKYVSVDYIFNKEGESFNVLKNSGITKLFIKGGDINYFCNKLDLKDCTSNKYMYVSSYMGSQPYYLYTIK